MTLLQDEFTAVHLFSTLHHPHTPSVCRQLLQLVAAAQLYVVSLPVAKAMFKRELPKPIFTTSFGVFSCDIAPVMLYVKVVWLTCEHGTEMGTPLPVLKKHRKLSPVSGEGRPELIVRVIWV